MLLQQSQNIGGFIETHLIAPDGLVYYLINEEEQRPLRDEDIPDCVCFKNIRAPKTLWKAGFFSYEDSNMATAEYMLGNIFKHCATNDETASIVARRCFNAIKAVAEAGEKVAKGVDHPMFGFLPKPYGGSENARLSSEVSVDQYLRVMYALEAYRGTIATPQEMEWIDRFLLACADCWDQNHYSFDYFGEVTRWGTGGEHAVAFGLYCSATGAFYRNEPHKHWFGIFSNREHEFEKERSFHLSDNAASLVTLAMARLCERMSKEKSKWTRYAIKAFNSAKKGIDGNGLAWLFPFLYHLSPGELIKPHWVEKGDGRDEYWPFLRWRGNLKRPCSMLAATAADLYELTGEEEYANFAIEQLARLSEKNYLKSIIPLTPSDLPEGYEMLGKTISGLNTVAWFRAFWQLSYQAEVKDGTIRKIPYL